MSSKIAIAGYGNLGKAIVANLKNFPDLELCAILSRRPGSIDSSFPVYDYNDAQKLKGKVDVMLMCGGSATDLPVQSPQMAQLFNIVDSFDTHAKIPQHFDAVDSAAKKGGNLAVISAGWDPGLFSLMRTLFCAVLPAGQDYTFWGKGVSQGHSDALRRISGVEKAIQYTVPKEDALKAVKSGKNPVLTTREKHLRECFVVAPQIERARIESEIKAMPNYFADYDTVVHFISAKEFDEKHTALPHGGFVFRSGSTDEVTRHLIEFSIKLDSNPHFTASILLAYARAAAAMAKEGKKGAFTVLDIPFSYLTGLDKESLMKLI